MPAQESFLSLDRGLKLEVRRMLRLSIGGKDALQTAYAISKNGQSVSEALFKKISDTQISMEAVRASND
ncbi:hypothetical protein TNCV_1276801 [Trichonephila clavipes]|nr:hypothetical protein TNCV_1276801 [Trichonephila clavipes]